MSDNDRTAGAVPNEAAIFLKVSLRLLPFLFLLYVINLIDRTNIGIARLQMVKQAVPDGAVLPDLENDPAVLSATAYSFGASIFYLGYLLFEVPSNLILLKMGARAWIARILLSWGLVSAAMMFVQGPWSFAFLRFLLGVAEAGFFPGIIFYLSDWFPARVRARAVANFMIGGVIATMIGNPVSGLILQSMDQVGGLWGWQWVFLLEGIPAVILGFITLAYLTDHPSHARWLTPDERTWLVTQIENDRRLLPANRTHSFAAAMFDPRVWLLIAVYFTVAMGDNSFGFYIPTFLRSQFPEATPFEIGLLIAGASVIAMIGMLLVGRSSDRTGERRWHVAGSAFTASLGWVIISLAATKSVSIPGLADRWLFMVGVAVTLTGMKSMLPTFWTLPPMFLTGAGAASGIALINSVANLGGWLAPNIIGLVETATGQFNIAYQILAGVLFAGGLLVLFAKTHRNPEPSPASNLSPDEPGRNEAVMRSHQNDVQ